MSKGRKVIRIPMRGPQHPKQSIPRQKNLIDAIDASGGGSGEWTPTRATRADLPPTREQIMADPRVMALVGALKTSRDYVSDASNGWMVGVMRRRGETLYFSHEGMASDDLMSIDAALAALTDNEGDTE